MGEGGFVIGLVDAEGVYYSPEVMLAGSSCPPPPRNEGVKDRNEVGGSGRGGNQVMCT